MFRIKKLDIFIAKQFGLLFVGTFFICLFVLMMQFLWRYVDELIGKGLSMEILAQFFWYMALGLMPQAFPLAILLSSLIAYGNLGESSELTAIKAAGISLMQSMRSLIFIVLCIAGISFYFQNVVVPSANMQLKQLLVSMKQKSPELEIPEGTFYDGIPNSNLYVEKKDLKTGHLYGIMIYRQTGSYEDQTIILADSGMLQSTAEKKHLLLTLWNGEWFENMRSQDMGGTAEVPYRRESFGHKQILLDFDGDFNLADASNFTNDASAKSVMRILHDLDSIKLSNDSIGRSFFEEARNYTFRTEELTPQDSVKLQSLTAEDIPVMDSVYAKMNQDKQREVARQAARQAQNALSDVEMKSDYAKYQNRLERVHLLEAIGKFTLALSCIIFFFIGAPLGAIIRKGGLGVPVIVSVIVFLVFYLLDMTGMRMARDDNWTVWFGRSISTVVLAPLAVFFTYKANRDSTVFNIDAYRLLLMRILGLRMKRNITRKEVIIEEPKYRMDANMLQTINEDIAIYSETHKLLRWPSPIKVFFRAGDDHEIEHINEVLETTIEDLGYARDKHVLYTLNEYPIIATHAHTRPFEKKWLNIVSGLFLPLGIFFYCRMIRFRLRLYRDLRDISNTSNKLMPIIQELADKQKDKLLDETYKDYTKLEIQQNDGDIQAEQDK
ncbi:lipopolysaccharide export system permease protein [Prevotella communis]|uniref:Lipopolysaccharide export system permease protein n=1 Tax=Prevotella communis TaxID=2913614 RepID=A0A1H0K6H5_9BACT|nr:LptF/LptG family permease [Prevotella communis]SDO51350.1 lipopolysaccharide export system permease protein [Prevotella communis]